MYMIYYVSYYSRIMSLIDYPSNYNAGLVLAQRRRRRPNIKPKLVQVWCLLGIYLCHTVWCDFHMCDISPH